MNIARKTRSASKRLTKFVIYHCQHRQYMRQQLDFLRSKKTSETAFLIATGPSIKRQNLALLGGQDCFTISNAFLHSDIGVIQPIAHGFAAYHEPMDKENYIQWLRQATERLPPSTVIYTDCENKYLVNESGISASRSVVYGLYDSAAKWLWPKYCKYLFLSPQSGPLLMLPLIVSMGYKRICLVGCDHTVLRDYGGFVANFYESRNDVRKNATNPAVWTDIVGELNSNIIMFRQYKTYAGWCRSMGIEVLNLSDDSWLREYQFSTIDKEVRAHVNFRGER